MSVSVAFGYNDLCDFVDVFGCEVVGIVGIVGGLEGRGGLLSCGLWEGLIVVVSDRIDGTEIVLIHNLVLKYKENSSIPV
jgi:hypothetical protein